MGPFYFLFFVYHSDDDCWVQVPCWGIVAAATAATGLPLPESAGCPFYIYEIYKVYSSIYENILDIFLSEKVKWQNST